MVSPSPMLILDPSIRDWVVLPMVAIMILMGLCRHYASVMLKSAQKMDVEELKQRQVLQRTSRLRMRGGMLPAESFNARKAYFCAKERGLLNQAVKKSGTNPMLNPLGMVDSMKGNLVYMLPNMVMMGIISFFFQGFIILKVPFALTRCFKVMLQRGVDLESLDVSYVSSLSWYFLVMFGLRGLFKIILGEDSESLDESEAAQRQMTMGMSMGGGGGIFDAPAAYKHERESLEMVQHHAAAFENVELELLGEMAAARIAAAKQHRGLAAAHPSQKRAPEKKRRIKVTKISN